MKKAIVIMLVIVAIVTLLAWPREKTFKCAFCEEYVTQIPVVKNERIYQLLYGLSYDDKICDECNKFIEQDLKGT